MDEVYKKSFLLMFSVFTINPSWIWIEERPAEALSLFTISTQQRYYYVSRLENAVNFIMEKKYNSFCSISLEKEQFIHPVVKTVAEELFYEHTLDPFFLLWIRIKDFKYLEDTLLIKEFTRLIYFMLQQMNVYKEKELFSRDNQMLLAELLDKVDSFIQSHKKIMSFDHFEIDPGFIACRFFVIKRLQKVFDQIEKSVQQKEKVIFNKGFIAFESEIIRELYFKLKKEQNLVSLKYFCERIKSFRYISDMVLVNNFLQLVFIIFESLIEQKNQKYKNDFMGDFLFIGSQLPDLSLLELLDGIDIALDFYKQSN